VSNEGLIAKKEFEETFRRLPIIFLHPRIFLEELRETTTKVSKKSRISSRDSKIGSLENEVIIRSTCLLVQVSYYPAFSFYTI
jgi:hypothetical protein